MSFWLPVKKRAHTKMYFLYIMHPQQGFFSPIGLAVWKSGRVKTDWLDLNTSVCCKSEAGSTDLTGSKVHLSVLSCLD